MYQEKCSEKKLLFPYIFAWRNVANQSMTTWLLNVSEESSGSIVTLQILQTGKFKALANQELVGKPCCIQLPAHAGTSIPKIRGTLGTSLLLENKREAGIPHVIPGNYGFMIE